MLKKSKTKFKLMLKFQQLLMQNYTDYTFNYCILNPQILSIFKNSSIIQLHNIDCLIYRIHSINNKLNHCPHTNT